jgi:hypothetical protein
VAIVRAAAVAGAALLVGPPVAHAASISVDRACYAAGEPVSLSGEGFAPAAPVSVTGFATATTNADAAGAFAGLELTAPKVASAAPREVSLRAASPTRADLAATVTFPVVRARYWSNAPISGRPSQRVTWRFAGFAPDRPIYGHLRFGGKGVTTRRFGVARGPCGLLTTTAPRVPLRHLRPGRWQLKLDQVRAYSAKTPGRIYTFRVSRAT